MKTKKILLLILGVLLAAAVVVGLVFGVKALIKAGQTPEATGTQPVQTGEPVPTGESGATDPTATEPTDPETLAVKAKEAYTEDDITADDPRLDEVVAECGDYKLTNRLNQIFYGMQYVSFMSQYGGYAEAFGLDPTKPLKEQSSMEAGLTWEQSFEKAALKEFRHYAASATASNKAGYVLPEEEREDMETFLSGLAEEGADYGFDSADTYLQDSFGTAIRFEDYASYLRLYFQAMSYENSLYMSVNPSDEELEAYRQANAEEFPEEELEKLGVDVRHILILSDPDNDGTATDEEKAAAQAKAEELLAAYLADPTEEHFADLAIENSEDPGSQSKGGLYEGVTEGQMVDTFNDWCFDKARKPGDTGIVETSYGFHVMYFVQSEPVWKATARHELRMEYVQPLVDEMAETYPCEIDYEKIVLSPLPMAEATE